MRKAARRKLESRRLAYDATLSKMQKQKKEDFRIEEELRAQRIKYEESSDDVYRRMGEIQDGEAESMSDLGAFLDAEFEYYDRCRDIMANLRRQWPASQQKSLSSRTKPSTTAHSFNSNSAPREESPPPPIPEPECRPAIGSRVKTSASERVAPINGFRLPLSSSADPKPGIYRTNTAPSFEGPAGTERMMRTRSEQSNHAIQPPPLPRNRPAPSESYENDYSRPVHHESDHSRPYNYDRSDSSPAISSRVTSRGVSRSNSGVNLEGSFHAGAGAGRKNAPSSPPAVRKKPPPPPPPKKITSGF